MITSSNNLCSMITCPLCRLIFPYHQHVNQFPISYIHRQLMDLVPMNLSIQGKCSKCKTIHSLNFCPCCNYHLCDKCRRNDRENLLINLEDLLRTSFNTIPSDLSHKAHLILINPQTTEMQDILTCYHQIANSPSQNGGDSSRIEQIDCESNVLMNEQDDDDIIYVDTIQATLAK